MKGIFSSTIIVYSFQRGDKLLYDNYSGLQIKWEGVARQGLAPPAGARAPHRLGVCPGVARGQGRDTDTGGLTRPDGGRGATASKGSLGCAPSGPSGRFLGLCKPLRSVSALTFSWCATNPPGTHIYEAEERCL